MSAGSITATDDLEEVHEINVTPFIDVMLVLLIIFMVAAPLATVDVSVDLPASTAEPQPRPDKPLFLTVKADLSLASAMHRCRAIAWRSARRRRRRRQGRSAFSCAPTRPFLRRDDGCDESAARGRLFEGRACRVGKNSTIAVAMDWDGFWLWTVSAAAVLALHAVGACRACPLARTLGPATNLPAAIVIDLAPLTSSERDSKDDIAPGPLQQQSEAAPELVEARTEGGR